MTISISEARQKLPELVRRVRRDPGTTIQITLRDEVVAELRAPDPEPEPGAAARKLLEVMERFPNARGRKTAVSSRVKEHLYSERRGKR